MSVHWKRKESNQSTAVRHGAPIEERPLGSTVDIIMYVLEQQQRRPYYQFGSDRDSFAFTPANPSRRQTPHPHMLDMRQAQRFHRPGDGCIRITFCTSTLEPRRVVQVFLYGQIGQE